MKRRNRWCLLAMPLANVHPGKLLALFLVLAAAGFCQTPKAPLLVLLDGDPKPWQAWCKAAGWELAFDPGSAEKNLDQRILKVEALVKQSNVDPGRIYLVGQGDGASAVFYLASRMPDLWAAAVALGGSPRPAIDSNRLFAANTTLIPVLWLFPDKDGDPLAQGLKSAGFNLEWKVEPAANPEQVFKWLGAHQRDAFPPEIDCETGSPSFPHCYWVEMTKFDPSQRNDVLDSTRIPPIGSGAVLDLGGFACDIADPGPGVLVSGLAPDYQGPLRLKDRILAIAGKSVANAQAFIQLMDQAIEERAVAVTVERGKDRLRLETRIVVPKRQEPVTARVQARYLPDLKEIQVLSRTITGMRVTVPPAWVPASLNWNGSSVAKAEAPGCWLLQEQKQLLSARPCP